MNKKMHALGVAIIAAIVYLLVFILAFTPVITTRGTQKLGIISGRILLNTADLDEDDYDDLREDLEDDIADVDDASIVSLVKICKRVQRRSWKTGMFQRRRLQAGEQPPFMD